MGMRLPIPLRGLKEWWTMNRLARKNPKPDDIEFEARYVHGPYARIIFRQRYFSHDLSDATEHARRTMNKAEPMATGFYVLKVRDTNHA